MLENKNLPRSRPRISGLRNFKSFVNLDDASHQPARPLHENLQHRLKSIPPMLKGSAESTGTKSPSVPVALIRCTTVANPALDFNKLSDTWGSGREAMAFIRFLTLSRAISTEVLIEEGDPHGTPRISRSSSGRSFISLKASGMAATETPRASLFERFSNIPHEAPSASKAASHSESADHLPTIVPSSR